MTQPASAYTAVPAAERLTFGGVFADASIEVQAVMVGLLAATLAAAAVWALGLRQAGRAEGGALAGALGLLKMVSGAGVLVGLVAASFILLSMFIGIANVRPTPSLTVLAPGFAEAAMAVMLGLLASSVAVICQRHLEARIRGAAAG